MRGKECTEARSDLGKRKRRDRRVNVEERREGRVGPCDPKANCFSCPGNCSVFLCPSFDLENCSQNSRLPRPQPVHLFLLLRFVCFQPHEKLSDTYQTCPPLTSVGHSTFQRVSDMYAIGRIPAQEAGQGTDTIAIAYSSGQTFISTLRSF